MSDDWAVTYIEPNERTIANSGTVEVVQDQPSEEVARQVYADTRNTATALGRTNVQLRHGGEVVEP